MTGIRTVIAMLVVLAGISGAFAETPGRDAVPTDALYDQTVARGDALLQGGDSAGAEELYRAALQLGPEGESRADLLDKLSMALAQQARYAEAEPLLAEAEKIARASRGGKSALLAEVLRTKTFVLYRTGRVEQARAAFREAKAIREANAGVWRTEADGITWQHTPSHWRFPAKIGPFKRLARTMIDETGHDVVVHYRIGPGGRAAPLVSVYVSVDRGVPLAKEFEADKLEIIRQYPNATIRFDGPKTVLALAGREVVMDLPPRDDGWVRRTSFSAFEEGKVMIRVRASYPKTEAATREKQVAAFVEKILKPPTSP